MNFVALTGGLGNQMFIYAFKVALSQNSTTVLFHPHKSSWYGHAGYQLEQLFHIEKDSFKTRVVLFLFSIYWYITRLFPKQTRPSLLRMIGVKEYCVPSNFVYYDGIIDIPFNRVLFRGTWQSEKFFEPVADKVRHSFEFRESLLNAPSRHLWERILQMQNPVSLHIRRDDYLSPAYASGFGGICTVDYYRKAVEYIKHQVEAPFFLVFSDDIEWCRENLDFEGALFVDINKGKDSWQDMFLMSKCKHNIIANSSFSWWGAWLNSNEEKIVIAPKVWWNGIKDDVIPEGWIRL